MKAIHNGECSSALSSETTTITTSSEYVVGDIVKVSQFPKNYATGEKIKSFVKGSTYEIIRIKEDKLLLSKIVSWVYTDDVEKVNEANDTIDNKSI